MTGRATLQLSPNACPEPQAHGDKSGNSTHFAFLTGFLLYWYFKWLNLDILNNT